MRVLVIPDVHLRTWMFDDADQILRDGRPYGNRQYCVVDTQTWEWEGIPSSHTE